MSLAAFTTKLEPILAFLDGRDLSDAKATMAALEAAFPFASPSVQEIGELFAKGVAEGWLCDREGGGSKFSRVAKPSESSKMFSIDAVQLSGAGVWHRHTTGEVDLCFAIEGKAKFDGHGAGWVVFPPMSDHVPTVSDGRMNILYFIPGGQVEWKRA